MRVSLVSLVVGLAIIGYIESLSADLYMVILRTELCRRHLADMVSAKNKTYYFQPSKGTALTSTVYEANFSTAIDLNKEFTQAFEDAGNFYKGKNLKGKSLQCFKNGFIDVDGKYSKLFANKKISAAAETIIDDYKEYVAPYLKSPSEIAYLWKSWGSAAYPKLVNYTLKNDYSTNIYDYYVNDEAYDCETPSIQASEEYFSCVYPSMVKIDKKKNIVASVITNPKPENLAICSLLQARNCSLPYTRYWTLYDYTNTYPTFTIPSSKKEIGNYFDELLGRAQIQINGGLAYNFTYLYARWNSSYLYTRAFNTIQKNVVLSDCNFTDIIINTTQIRVIGKWELAKDNVTCILTRVNFTSKITYQDSKKNTKYATPSIEFVINSINTKKYKSAGTYVSDPKTKLKYLFVRYTKLADSTIRMSFDDLYSMAYIEVDNKRINAYIQRKNLFSPYEGILITGFEDTEPISGRRKRDESAVLENACSVQCKSKGRWTRSVEADDGRTFTVHDPGAQVECAGDCIEANIG